MDAPAQAPDDAERDPPYWFVKEWLESEGLPIKHHTSLCRAVRARDEAGEMRGWNACADAAFAIVDQYGGEELDEIRALKKPGGGK